MRRHEDAEGHYTDSEVHYTDFTDAFTAEADFPNLAAMPWPSMTPTNVHDDISFGMRLQV